MGFMDSLKNKLRNELIDIIEWIDDSNHTIAWRFPRYQNEIKNGAQLIVRPGQMAVFVHRGELADVFEPGHYKLTTDNLPILGTLLGWKYGFNSPFRSEVYFVSTKQVTDLKWGTPNPIMLRDDDFGPVRLRAFGTYSLKVIDPRALIKELVGTDGDFQVEEVTELLRSIIVTAFADMLGEQKVAALDLAARYREMSDGLRENVCERIDDEYGLEVPQLFIVNISLPEEVEKAIDTRSSMGAIGDMNKFQQFQMGKAMLSAAENEAGGGAGEGMGLGMGFAMANRMVQSPGMAPPGTMPQAAGSVPPPPPAVPAWHVAVNGQTTGPFTMQQIAQQITSNQLSKSTTVWSAGMSGWLPAGEVPQLTPAFGAVPPPPPPPAP